MNLFHPNRDITRQESAVMLENAYLSYTGESYNDEGKKTTSESTSDLLKLKYKDFTQIKNWANGSVALLSEWDVMKGVSNDIFRPDGYYTREQCIATFIRLYRFAPISRGHNGKSLCPYSPDELITQVRSKDFYHETNVLKNDFCTVLQGYQSSTRGQTSILTVVYNDGGMYNLERELDQIYTSVQNIYFAEKGYLLKVTGWDKQRNKDITRIVNLKTRKIMEMLVEIFNGAVELTEISC